LEAGEKRATDHISMLVRRIHATAQSTSSLYFAEPRSVLGSLKMYHGRIHNSEVKCNARVQF
jgi:hypothetical protein